MSKTDDATLVGVHKFEAAGLGKAPFRYVGIRENVWVSGDGSVRKPGGTCDYCGNGIQWEFHIKSADGRCSKVGCNCIEKVGDEGILKAYRTSPEYRAAQAQKRAAKAAAVTEALKTLLADSNARAWLQSSPHPRGFVDRKTGAALTLLDQVEWLFNNSGASGREWLLKALRPGGKFAPGAEFAP